MKSKILYASLFPLLPFISIMLLHTRSIDGPEQTIIGEWEEISWKYEKMDHSSQTEISIMEELDDRVKSEIAGHLIIHKAEVWKFSDTRDLQLVGDQGSKPLTWTLKGRGNIVELSSSDGTVETYQIQELTNQRMVLHFNSDLQVRGIVEMEFRKVD